MDLKLSWLATLAVIVVAIVIGSATAFALRQGPARTLWAIFVALVFFVSAAAAVVLDHSWMFNDSQRALAEGLALGAAVTGITYAMRAPS